MSKESARRLATRVKTRNKKKNLAAELIAQGDLKDVEVAKAVGVNSSTIARWRIDEPFKASVEEARAAIRAGIRAEGIANKQNRIDAYNDRWERLIRVIAERAADVAYEGIAGGETGLLVRTYKQVGSGRDAELVTEFTIDTGLLSELRAHEKQAAQELGQWIEKSEQTGETAVLGLVGIKIEDL